MKKESSKLTFLKTDNKITIFIFLIFLMTTLFFLVGAESGGGPLIDLKSPFNNTIDLDGNITFSYNITNSTSQMDNCSLIFDGTINQTDSNITVSEVQYFYLNNLVNGDYNWSVDCTHTDGNESSSETRDLEIFIDTTSPIVTLNGPANSSIDTDGDVIFDYTVTDDGWATKCDLYTDINGTWQINQTNVFVQENVSLYFEIDNIPDDTTFKWNVACYDFASNPNSDWADANWTITINNTAPTSTTIPNQVWDEDNPHTINLSIYFSDADGDNLTYSSTSPNNITVLSIDNSTGIATLNPDLNWNGNRTIIFYAFDIMNQNATSNSVNLTVNEGSDDPPRMTFASPSDNITDSDGYVFFNCSAFDDYNLANVSLYTNVSGSWTLEETKEFTGINNWTLFNVTNVSEGTYKWAFLISDNASQSSWGDNRTFNVSMTVELEHDISDFTINHIDHNRTILISYSSYLNNSIALDNLTIYFSNGSIYFNKNMSNSPEFEINSTDPPLNYHPEKIRINYNETFYNNFTVGNKEWLNISLKYYYLGNERQISTKHTIEVKSA